VLQENERVDQENQIANEANQKYTMLEDKIKFMEQKLAMMMERQQSDISIGTRQIHSHYAQDFDDQPLP